ncbi:MAG: phosphopantothenoylcysteine decarboxylase [Proteobacteria bacterium]|nr:phosphopantothenoylcysteine decarboxylase [Pseudomonadota bacterium]
MTSSSSTSATDLEGYEVLVAVAGGIASYKVCTVVSQLVQRGVGVTVAMTEAATRFVGPLTFGTLSGRPVITNLWDEAHLDPQHIHLTESADLVVVAPATANLLAKMAQGIADDAVTTLLVSVTSPVLIAPAMNSQMWDNPFVQRNLKRLVDAGHHVVGPEEGWMACRTVGVGRMTEPERILDQIETLLRASARRGQRETPGR